MRRAAWLALLPLVPLAGRGSEVPDPLFWPDEAAFAEQVRSGEFDDLLELHLLQYAADPAWRGEWRALRYSANGLFGQWGSITSADLYVDDAIALNLFPHERFQLRFDRREYRDRRLDARDLRFDALWHTGRGFALALTGWPSSEKDRASIGGGLRIGAPRARSALELRLVADVFTWNDRTRTEVHFDRQPLRLLSDGYWEAGPWRVHGSADLGREYAPTPRPPGRPARGLQRLADIEAQWTSGPWTAGARATASRLERSQEEAAGPLRLGRDTWRGVLSLRRAHGRWSASALAGWAWQRDDFESSGSGAGHYEASTFLLGIEGGVEAAQSLTLRLGYLAASQRMDRSVDLAGLLPDREEEGYRDKAHARAVYTFAPGMAVEALLSHSIQGGAFGGGAVKALFAF
jgi:hypothetical protein